MSNGQKGQTGENFLKPWSTPAIFLTLIAGVAMLGYMVFYRIPDLEKQLEQSRTEQSERTKGWEREQRERFGRLEGQLVKVRTNLIRLCTQGKQQERVCHIDDLVVAVNDVTTLQAQLLVSAKMEHPSGQTPAITSPELRGALASQIKYPGGVATSNKEDIAKLMTWSSSAKDAQWAVMDGKLTVRFSNGTAVFRPDPSVSAELLNRAASDLNTMSRAVSAATEGRSQAPSSPPSSTTVVPRLPGGVAIEPLPSLPSPAPYAPHLIEPKASAK
jgi:hypothetical protein